MIGILPLLNELPHLLMRNSILYFLRVFSITTWIKALLDLIINLKFNRERAIFTLLSFRPTNQTILVLVHL